MAELAASGPQLVDRFNLLTLHCWLRGWEIGVTSSTRSRATQQDLYRRWRLGLYDVPSVANPYTRHGKAPAEVGGFDIIGSYHMPQGAAGHSWALDLNWRGCSSTEFEELAWHCGLRQTVPDEDWHYQPFNRSTMFAINPAMLIPLVPHLDIPGDEMDPTAIAEAIFSQKIPQTYDLGTPDQRVQDIEFRQAFANLIQLTEESRNLLRRIAGVA